MSSKFFIPIEIKDCELHGKIILAKAVKRGYVVYIGDQREISTRCFELGIGIYHDKSLAKQMLNTFKNLKKGYKICSLMRRGPSI